jgi:acyl dehydratase
MLNFDAVGQSLESPEFSWTDKDVLLYALAVGASQDDASSELQFTTENTGGVDLRVLPTFGALVAQQAAARPKIGDIPPGMALHAEQAVTLHAPLPAAARVRARSTVTGMYDKTSGALVVTETDVYDAATGALLLTTRGGTFLRGEGGFGGDRGPRTDWKRPDRDPDLVVSYPTRPDQALLYRLTGDRNPLHSDPALARKRGTDRPILHGMCTYGFTGRALLHALCDSDPDRFLSMSGRFTAPVLPGEVISVSIWQDGGTAQFQTVRADGAVAIDHGGCSYLPPAAESGPAEVAR